MRSEMAEKERPIMGQVKRGLRRSVQAVMSRMRRHPRGMLTAGWLLVLLLAMVSIPGILVNRLDRTNEDTALARTLMPPIMLEGGAEHRLAAEQPISFPIYLAAEQRIASVTLEAYVRGVVAAEMPIEFELEALKAQAIAARTYIVRRLVMKDISHVPVEGAWVTDTVQHQAYLTDEKIEAKWDPAVRTANLKKLNQAVEETRGQILTYDGIPILAAFFSTSNGYTENSEEYWSDKLPYLRSVASPWEAELSPKFTATLSFTPKEFAQKLGISQKNSTTVRVLETSAGNRIRKIKIGGHTFTGREVREKLGLASTQFDIRSQDGSIEVTTYGNGHGVGLSQWGAQGMALKGYKAEEILQHYYQHVTIEAFRGPDAYLSS